MKSEKNSEEGEYLLHETTSSSRSGQSSSSECTIVVAEDTVREAEGEGIQGPSDVQSPKSKLEAIGSSIVNLFTSTSSTSIADREVQKEIVHTHSEAVDNEIQTSTETEVEDESKQSAALPSPRSLNAFDRILALSRKLSTSELKQKVCVICLETLTEEDFGNGDAISLQCGCKGDITYRHLACAVKWAQVKGSTMCDICKKPIENLPNIDDLPPPDLVEPLTPEDTEYLIQNDTVPPALDLSFDFLRITWIATIVCVLLVQLDLQESLWVGSVVGLTYILVMKFVQCCSPYGRERQPVNNLASSREEMLSNSLSSPPATRSPSYSSTAWYGVVTPPV